MPKQKNIDSTKTKSLCKKTLNQDESTMKKITLAICVEEGTGRQLKGGISTDPLEINSSDELREYLYACSDGIVYSWENNTPELQEHPQKKLPLREYLNQETPPNPPRKTQLRKILRICRDNGISTNQIAKKYGVSSIQDIPRKDCNEFINKYK